MKHRYRHQIRNVYVVAAISTLLLVASFSLLGLRPLIEYLRETHAESIELALQNSAGRLQMILNHHQALAQQAASRTAIRLEQAAYVRGEITQQALVEFSRPKLADAISTNPSLLGIARYAPDGRRLYAVGQPVPEVLAAHCDATSLAAVTLLPHTAGPQGAALAYCSPILDPLHGRVGMDLLLVSDQPIQALIDEQSTATDTLAVVSGTQRIVYWPQSAEAATGAREALQRYLREGAQAAGFVIRTQPLGVADWRLASVVDAGHFFAPIATQTRALVVATLMAAAAIFVLNLLALRPIVSVLVQEEALLRLARSDRLTGLHNHGYMQELLDGELARAARYQRPLTLLLLDIDHFKQLNDQCGHPGGDAVLAQLATLCTGLIRDSDRLARYGGEEFLLILPETSVEEGARLAERLRARVAQHRFQVGDQDRQITVSVGLVGWDGTGTDTVPTKAELVRCADRALYRSKALGRDRVTSAGTLRADAVCPIA